MSAYKRRGSAKRKFLVCLCVFLSVVLVILAAGTAYMEGMLGLVGRHDPNNWDGMSESEFNDMIREEEGSNTGPEMDPDDVEWGDIPELVQGKHIINILLIGQDRRAGEGRSRSDSMILCTINLSKKTITLTSFMRDMYVQIPGYNSNRINASYAFGGMELLDDTLKKNFDINIHGNLEVDFFGFQKAIDTVGGVEINLSAAEANYLNKWGNWDVEDNAGQWTLQEGVNLLNGSQALAYSRIREIGNSDFGRTNRQRVVLSALMDKAKTMSVPKLNSLMKELLPLMTTDMSNSEIMSIAMELFPILGELELETKRIPADGTYTNSTIRGMAVLVPDLPANCEILAEIMSE